MTDEYLEERLRFTIRQKYLKEVGRATLEHLNLEQLKKLNRRCRKEQT